MDYYLDIVEWLLAFFGGLLTGILVERYREKNLRRREHFKQIKNCLIEVRNELQRIFLQNDILRLGESISVFLDKTFEPNLAPWKKYQIGGSNRVIIEDLKYHFPELYKALFNVDNIVARELMIKYLESLSELIKRLHQIVKEFGIFKPKVFYEKGVSAIALRDPIRKAFMTALFNMAIGLSEEHWPNSKKELEKWSETIMIEVKNLANQVAEDEDSRSLIEEINKLRNRILKEVASVIQLIDEKLILQKLPNDCRFI